MHSARGPIRPKYKRRRLGRPTSEQETEKKPMYPIVHVRLPTAKRKCCNPLALEERRHGYPHQPWQRVQVHAP